QRIIVQQKAPWVSTGNVRRQVEDLRGLLARLAVGARNASPVAARDGRQGRGLRAAGGLPAAEEGMQEPDRKPQPASANRQNQMQSVRDLPLRGLNNHRSLRGRAGDVVPPGVPARAGGERLFGFRAGGGVEHLPAVLALLGHGKNLLATKGASLVA